MSSYQNPTGNSQQELSSFYRTEVNSRAKPLFPKRLLLQLDHVVVTCMLIPFDVASSILVPLKSQGLPLERPGRELLSSPCSPVSV
ncbi:hypothetical protein DPMN_106964 [Dreissena polymorpha]|uniref:Uncharacterized protein n=1 Tax=Dreissena polymorpha TaxID=45954 RepID=A0A9D4K663_DREPO|nr:hypothetical protein DPMN_106964 [Dreissena polymorpha]